MMKTFLAVVGALVPAAIAIFCITVLCQVNNDTENKLRSHSEDIKNSKTAFGMQQALMNYRTVLDTFPNASAVSKEKFAINKELDLLAAYREDCKCEPCCCKDKCVCDKPCRVSYVEKQLVNSAADRLDPLRLKMPNDNKVTAYLGYSQSWYPDAMMMVAVFGILLTAVLLLIICFIE